MITIATAEKIAYNLTNLQSNNSQIYNELQTAKDYKIKNPNFSANIPDPDSSNPNFDIQAFWKPVSFWNYFIILGIMAVITCLNYWGKSVFDKSKWAESNCSPFNEYSN